MNPWIATLLLGVVIGVFASLVAVGLIACYAMQKHYIATRKEEQS